MSPIIKNKQDYTQFYCLLTFLLILVFLRYALQIDIPRFFFVMLIALAAVLGNHNEILAITMCCIPLHEAIDFYYSIVILMTVYVLKNHKRIRINLPFLLVLAMICWELLHCFNSSFSIIKFVATIAPIMFLAVLLSADIADLDYGFIVRAMAVAAAAGCITLLGMVLYASDFNLIEAITGLRRLGIFDESVENNSIIAGKVIHPNSLGVVCVLATTGLLQLRSGCRGKTSDIFLMLVLLVFGALTSSRTFLVCLALMVLLMTFAQRGDLKRKLRFLLTVSLILILAVLLLYFFFPDLFEYFVGRFFVEDITTGRMDLMSIYNKFIANNISVMFFGIGLHDYGVKLTETYRVANNVPHNNIQEIVIAWGIPGLIMIAVLLVLMIWKSKRSSKKLVLLNYIPLLIILVKSLAGQMLTSGYTMLALSFAYLSLAQSFISIQTDNL